MEQLNLTTAIPAEFVPGKLITTYKIIEIRFNWPNAEIDVHLVDEWGTAIHGQYTGPEATTIMQGLNTANMASKSLHKRTIERLQADGKLPAGTISGTP